VAVTAGLCVQVRFELCAQALDASIQTISPWREPEFLSRFKGRKDLLDYAAAHNIPVGRRGMMMMMMVVVMVMYDDEEEEEEEEGDDDDGE
jgi:hypothetical protein